MTAKTIDDVDNLSEKELLVEIKYLRATIAPNIRQKRRIKVGDRFEMEKFTEEELIQSIRNAIKP